jgi:hypothetical protein
MARGESGASAAQETSRAQSVVGGCAGFGAWPAAEPGQGAGTTRSSPTSPGLGHPRLRRRPHQQIIDRTVVVTATPLPEQLRPAWAIDYQSRGDGPNDQLPCHSMCEETDPSSSCRSALSTRTARHDTESQRRRRDHVGHPPRRQGAPSQAAEDSAITPRWPSRGTDASEGGDVRPHFHLNFGHDLPRSDQVLVAPCGFADRMRVSRELCP